MYNKWTLSHHRWPIPLLLLLFLIYCNNAFTQKNYVSWIESFDLPNGTMFDSDSTSWIAIEGEISDNKLMFNNTSGFWISEPILLYGEEVTIDIFFGSAGKPLAEDLLKFSYEIDGREHKGKVCGAFPDGQMHFTAKGQYLTLQIEAQTHGTYFLHEIRIESVNTQDDSLIPTTLPPGPVMNSLPWDETFDLPESTTEDKGETAWSSSGGSIKEGKFVIHQQIGSWESSLIDTRGKSFIVETVYGSKGNPSQNDFLHISYVVDGKTHVSEKQGVLVEGLEQFKAIGNMLQIRIEGNTSAEYYISSISIKTTNNLPTPTSPAPAPNPDNDSLYQSIFNEIPVQQLPWMATFNEGSTNISLNEGAWITSTGQTLQNRFEFRGRGVWKSAPINIMGEAQIDIELDYEEILDNEDVLYIIYDLDGKKDTSFKVGPSSSFAESRIISCNKAIITIESQSETAKYTINRVHIHREINRNVENSDLEANCKQARGRIKNIKENGSWRVVSDIGTNLRGIGGWWQGVFEDENVHEDPDLYYQDSWWKAMWENGLNVSRTICHDPFRRRAYGEGNGYNFNIPSDREAFIKKMDSAVALAKKYHMYIVINYHDVGGVDMNVCREFWNLVAPRYKDETHVIYEIMNEPEGARDWQLEDSRKVEEIYRLVRELAPETYILLCSFSNMGPDWEYNPNRSMLSAATTLRNIDWSNAGIAFHSYWGENLVKYVEDLIKEFPAINTEINLPLGYVTLDQNGDDHVRNEPLVQGEAWNQESMERLNIGWMTWEHDSWREFRHNYLASPNENLTNPGKPGLLYQAREEGWIWNFDIDLYQCGFTPKLIPEKPGITVFPNPVPSSFSHFSVKLPKDWQGATINIFNVQSELVYTNVVTSELINVPKLLPGIYNIIVNQPNNTEIRKVLIN